MPPSDSDSDSYDGGDFGTFFDEPEGFRPPPAPPSFSEHRMRAGHVLRVRTVGSHPLYVRYPPYVPNTSYLPNQ